MILLFNNFNFQNNRASLKKIRAVLVFCIIVGCTQSKNDFHFVIKRHLNPFSEFVSPEGHCDKYLWSCKKGISNKIFYSTRLRCLSCLRERHDGIFIVSFTYIQDGESFFCIPPIFICIFFCFRLDLECDCSHHNPFLQKALSQTSYGKWRINITTWFPLIGGFLNSIRCSATVFRIARRTINFSF